MFDINLGLFFVFIIGMIFMYLGGSFVNEKGNKMFIFVTIGTIACSLAFTFNSPKISDTYYLPAEIFIQDENGTCFTTNQGKYIVDKTGLNPDTEYLLTMATNGTEDVTDDEVCAIWEVK